MKTAALGFVYAGCLLQTHLTGFGRNQQHTADKYAHNHHTTLSRHPLRNGPYHALSNLPYQAPAILQETIPCGVPRYWASHELGTMLLLKQVLTT